MPSDRTGPLPVSSGRSRPRFFLSVPAYRVRRGAGAFGDAAALGLSAARLIRHHIALPEFFHSSGFFVSAVMTLSIRNPASRSAISAAYVPAELNDDALRATR